MILLILACHDYALTEEGDPTPSGDPVAGELSVQPDALDFGLLALGEQSAQVVVAENVGEGSLLLGLPVLDDEGRAFDVTGPGVLTLGPAESVEFLITYDPGHYADFAGDLLIESDSGVGRVSLKGGTLIPEIHLEPVEHDFGTHLVGESDVLPLLVENRDAGVLTLSAVDFAASSPELTLLSGPELVLAPGASSVAVVRYEAMDAGPEESTLTLWSDDPVHPSVSAAQFAMGEEPIPDPVDFDVTIQLTADDQWEGWLDGAALTGANQSGWSATDVFTQVLQEGSHALAVHGWDTASVISGFIATVEVNGSPEWVTGDGSWKMSTTSPTGSWTDISYNDSSWVTPPKCQDSSPWGSSPAALLSLGAKWIWTNANCRQLGQGWFRLDFDL